MLQHKLALKLLLYTIVRTTPILHLLKYRVKYFYIYHLVEVNHNGTTYVSFLHLSNLRSVEVSDFLKPY